MDCQREQMRARQIELLKQADSARARGDERTARRLEERAGHVANFYD